MYHCEESFSELEIENILTSQNSMMLTNIKQFTTNP